MRRVTLTLAALFVVFSASVLLGAKLNLTTYASTEYMLAPDTEDTWRIEDGTAYKYPKNLFELKLDINLDSKFSIFMKSSASTALDDRNKPNIFTFYDLHLTYKNDMGGKGIEAITFLREDGYFWMDQPLLRFTDNGESWGPKDEKGSNGTLSGVYFNAWNLLGLSLIKGLVVSRGYLYGGEDTVGQSIGAALRLRKDFFKGGLKLGMTGVYSREMSKESNTNDQVPPSHQVFGFDVDTNLLGPFHFVFEGGVGDFQEDHRTNYSNSKFYAYKGELRGTFDLKSFGNLVMLASVYYTDLGFPNWRGKTPDGNGDFFEETLELSYAFPLKAISLKQVFKYNHKVDGWDKDNFHIWDYSFDVTKQSYFESYSELYVEFINGFRFKTYYKSFDGAEYHDDRVRGSWKHLLLQLEVENKFAKIKPQVLLLNFDTPDYRAFAYGGEVLINLTDKIKFYTRFALMEGSKNAWYISSEGKSNWATFFCELQFLQVFPNTEMFITFGEGGHTDNDLVHDKDNGILNGRVLEKKIKFFLKFWL